VRDPYDYDPATDSVRVSRHDLARLLIQFRIELERRAAGRWRHMDDYDTSFERLADAVDHARAHAVAPYLRYDQPDYRMRCKRVPAYDWPDHPPYDGQAIEAVKVREGSLTGASPPGTSHYAYWDGRGGGHALCGFRFVSDDGPELITGEPTCRECVREKALAAALGNAP
jgi:hypothetical protein